MSWVKMGQCKPLKLGTSAILMQDGKISVTEATMEVPAKIGKEGAIT